MLIPRYTEKSTKLIENNQWSFDVDPKMTKKDIRQTVESCFNVRVMGVTTHRPPRKSRRLGQYAGFRSQIKRAIVSLRPGDSLSIDSISAK